MAGTVPEEIFTKALRRTGFLKKDNADNDLILILRKGLMIILLPKTSGLFYTGGKMARSF